MENDVGPIRFTGRIDRVDLNAEETQARIVDYKSSTPPTKGAMESGNSLQLTIYAWDGVGMVETYRHDGVHGDWAKLGDMITFEESLYLFDEPNCCPCNRQYLEHTWDGIGFQQTGSLILPTYEGEPPDHCQP